jgi:hypothetical protein
MSLSFKTIGARMCRVGFLAAAALAIGSVAAAAAGWTEKLFNPAPGSRWQIVSELERSETTVEDGNRVVVNLKKTVTSELVFHEKTADGGYRITFTRVGTKASGDTNAVELIRIDDGIMKGLAIRAVTDANGKPLRVENLADIRRKRQEIIDGFAKTVPADRDAFLRVVEGLTNVDEVGATAHLSDLELLSMAQNTGLRVGEKRRTTADVPSGIDGPPLTRARELSILRTDAATGNATMLLTESYTQASMREFLATIAARSGDVRPSDMRRMKMSFRNRYEIGVVDGMSRTLTEDSLTVSTLLGNSMAIKDKRKVTVSPL